MGLAQPTIMPPLSIDKNAMKTSQNSHALATRVTFLVAARMTMTTSRMTTTEPEAQMTLFNVV
jgi:hypothetical protein